MTKIYFKGQLILHIEGKNNVSLVELLKNEYHIISDDSNINRPVDSIVELRYCGAYVLRGKGVCNCTTKEEALLWLGLDNAERDYNNSLVCAIKENDINGYARYLYDIKNISVFINDVLLG